MSDEHDTYLHGLLQTFLVTDAIVEIPNFIQL